MPKDLLVEATFINPYQDPGLEWEHGFLLKAGEFNHFYKVSLESDGDWERYAKLGSGNYIGVLGTPSPALNAKPGERNLLQVVLARGVAWVFINGTFSGSFPTDIDTGGDGVSLYIDDEHVGRTEFEEFAIWKWHSSMYQDFPEVNPNYVPPATATPTVTPTPNPAIPFYGPETGVIFHEEADGKIERHRGPDINGDVMIDVTVVVPFEPRESNWNLGIQFRNDSPGSFHLIEVGSIFGGSFNHWRSSGPGEKWQGRIVEDVIGMNLQKGDRNRIQLIVKGSTGHLYINNRRAGIINFDLGDIPTANRIYLVVIDRDSQGYEYSRGGHTKFEDFTVWRWHPSLFDLPKDD